MVALGANPPSEHQHATPLTRNTMIGLTALRGDIQHLTNQQHALSTAQARANDRMLDELRNLRARTDAKRTEKYG